MDLTAWLSISLVSILLMFIVICRIYCKSSTSFEEMSNETNSTNMQNNTNKNQNLPENFDKETFRSISEQIQRTHSHATSALTLDIPDEVQSISEFDSISQF